MSGSEMKHLPLLFLALLLPLSACGGRPSIPPDALRPAPVSLAGERLGPPVRSEAAYRDAAMGWVARVDADGDRRLALAEVQADARRYFATLDLNSDGMVDVRELTQVRLAQREVQRTATGSDEPESVQSPDNLAGEAPRRDQRNGGGRLGAPDPVMAADRNVDFRVTADELAEEAGRRFAALDANGDGFLDQTELSAAVARAWERAPAIMPRQGRGPGR
ncbi:EF-hand domain-containing protein [Indioceanicola profundi]|uniref:EF-hand domain-containing protein n=1 Tax=Indioceanicola profundi TaxID=2220096 RepID=UPI000E6AB741|nr:hypothetical protein [Indioceanicola profundi]